MLQFFKGLGLDLSYPFPGYTHHVTHLFERKWSVVTGNPGTIAKGFTFQPPFAYFVMTGVSNKSAPLFASI